MPIGSTTPMSAINSHIDAFIQRSLRIIVRRLCYIGEQCVNTARASHTYTDQTGNLSSSLGYIVSVNGEIVQMSAFEQVKQGAEGAKDGKAYAMELVSRYPQGLALIVVAGMNYAAYVSDKGYDVLDSAESLANTLVPQMMSKLGLEQ